MRRELSLLRIGTKVRTTDRRSREHGRPIDRREDIGTIRGYFRDMTEKASAPYHVEFDDGDSGWFDIDEVERANVRTKAARCIYSGSIEDTYEAQRTARCACGWTGPAAPRKDRRVAGEVVPGWTVRIPAHASQEK